MTAEAEKTRQLLIAEAEGKSRALVGEGQAKRVLLEGEAEAAVLTKKIGSYGDPRVYALSLVTRHLSKSRKNGPVLKTPSRNDRMVRWRKHVDNRSADKVLSSLEHRLSPKRAHGCCPLFEYA